MPQKFCLCSNKSKLLILLWIMISNGYTFGYRQTYVPPPTLVRIHSTADEDTLPFGVLYQLLQGGNYRRPVENRIPKWKMARRQNHQNYNSNRGRGVLSSPRPSINYLQGLQNYNDFVDYHKREEQRKLRENWAFKDVDEHGYRIRQTGHNSYNLMDTDGDRLLQITYDNGYKPNYYQPKVFQTRAGSLKTVQHIFLNV